MEGNRHLRLGADIRRDVHLSPRGRTVAGSAGFLGHGRTILEGSLEGSSLRFVTKRVVTAGSDQREAVNHYAGTIEGDKIDMLLAIEDAASSHEPVSFVLSRVVA